MARSSINDSTFERPQPTEEEKFEEVGLSDEPKQPQPQPQPKKKSFLSRFGDSSEDKSTTTGDGKHHFHLPGRKRGQSGTAQELGDIGSSRPNNNGTSEVIVR